MSACARDSRIELPRSTPCQNLLLYLAGLCWVTVCFSSHISHCFIGANQAICLEPSSDRGSSPARSEEIDQLSASPTQSHLIISTKRRGPLSRKRPIPLSVNQQTTASPSLHAGPQPLFIPGTDEEREGGVPKRKKRRISSQATQSKTKTLNDLWRPRQVNEIFIDLWQRHSHHHITRVPVHLLLGHPAQSKYLLQ